MNEFLAWLASLIALVIPGFGAAPMPGYSGYVEADYVYAAPAGAGQIAQIAVHEGDNVRKGQLLFALADGQQRAAVAAADARVVSALANLENLSTGSRSDEIAVVRASLGKAEADLKLAQDTAERSAKLFAGGLVPQSKLDQDKATLASAEANVHQLEAQLKVAELPARDAQQAGAEANVTAARADADKARADLKDRGVLAPADGRIERLYYDLGEFAGAGMPVLSLLPAGALKVKFYVGEPDRPAVALGKAVPVSCDNCPVGLTATISYLASDPQFTPPVIYSRDERSRLSFLVEATLGPGSALNPGQPVSVGRPQ